MDADTLLALSKVILSGAITAILVPLAVNFSRYYWDRRRWHTFEGIIRIWAQAEFAFDDLSDDDWNALVAMKLSEAGFEPTKIKDLLELAVWFAQGRASQEAFEKIGFRQKSEADNNADESSWQSCAISSRSEQCAGPSSQAVETTTPWHSNRIVGNWNCPGIL